MFWYENHEKDHISPHHRNFKWSTQTHRDVGARQIHNMSLFVVYPITNSSTQFILPFYLVAPAYLIEALIGMVTSPHYHHSCWLTAYILLTTGLVFYVEQCSCSKVLFSQKQWYKELLPWSATKKEPLLKWVSGLCDCENTLFHCCTSTLLLVGKGDKMTVGESILLNWRSKSPYFAWIFCSPIHYRKDKVFYAYTIHKSPIYDEC